MSQNIHLTERQRLWLEHLRACERSDQSMKDYARHHDLSISAFYSWKKTLQGKGVLGTPLAVTQPLFQKVAVQDIIGVRLTLPAGLSLQIDAGTDPHWVAQLVQALS